ncbi:MAG: sel1 repeat family protein [Candidatus Electrothrix sp. AR3]|nr:sel1 repeat family protein [Candidatus Electrothrix sp. AR3]
MMPKHKFIVILLGLLLFQPCYLWADEQLTQEIRQLAEQGDPEAAFSMGLRYDLGDGVERDPELAAQWFEKAAKKKIAGAYLYLGMKYEFGAGVGQDKQTAIDWYKQAALRGWPQAAFLLGNLYLHLSTPNSIHGCAWLTLAAAQGYPGAEEVKANACSHFTNEMDRKTTALSRQFGYQISAKK